MSSTIFWNIFSKIFVCVRHQIHTSVTLSPVLADVWKYSYPLFLMNVCMSDGSTSFIIMTMWHILSTWGRLCCRSRTPQPIWGPDHSQPWPAPTWPCWESFVCCPSRTPAAHLGHPWRTHSGCPCNHRRRTGQRSLSIDVRWCALLRPSWRWWASSWRHNLRRWWWCISARIDPHNTVWWGMTCRLANHPPRWLSTISDSPWIKLMKRDFFK